MGADPMEHVSERSLETAKQVFDGVDKRGQGWLPTAEFSAILGDARIKQICGEMIDTRKVLAEVDSQGTGQVSFPDFLMWVGRVVLQSADKDLTAAFRAFEAKGGDAGSVDTVTMLHMLSGVGGDEERVEKAAAAAVLQTKPDAMGTIGYEKVLEKEARASDTYWIMEEVFSGK